MRTNFYVAFIPALCVCVCEHVKRVEGKKKRKRQNPTNPNQFLTPHINFSTWKMEKVKIWNIKACIFMGTFKKVGTFGQ